MQVFKRNIEDLRVLAQRLWEDGAEHVVMCPKEQHVIHRMFQRYKAAERVLDQYEVAETSIKLIQSWEQ